MLRTDQSYARNADGVFVPSAPVSHRDDQYASEGFATLLEMQRHHFWYRGRHRFLLHAVRRHVQPEFVGADCAAVDLGGACGGWIDYLRTHASPFTELAVADSSPVALRLAADVVGAEVGRYQVNLRALEWSERWHAAFLLDVLEHIPEDLQVLESVRRALRPGGVLFVTTPALQAFWSYNDEIARHVRRYSRHDFRRLAEQSGFELVDARYFMFLLSPLLWASRLRRPDIERMSPQEVRALLERTHRTPIAPVNRALALAFSLETPLGFWLPFPFGTSILGVFRRR